MVERENKEIPLSHQLALLQLNRSWYYDWVSTGSGKRVDEKDLIAMNLIDKWYTKYPHFGFRRITEHIRSYDGVLINHKKVRRLMRVMGLEAIYPKPNLSKSSPDHEVYPYLLRNLQIVKPNQVHGVDITYIRLKNTFLYLVAVIDWFSRYVLSWELSDTLETGFCISALERALAIAVPDIHNSDQGSQFTSREYLGVLKRAGARISMDGRGRALDNIFTERLWRSVKYEEVYLKDYDCPREARKSLDQYFHFYNQERLHSSLGYKTPAQIYFERR